MRNKWQIAEMTSTAISFSFFCETCKVLVKFKVSCDADTVCGRDSFHFVLWCYQSASCELLPLRFDAAYCTQADCSLKARGRTHTGLLETMSNEPGNFSVISWFQTMSWNWKRAANGLRYTCTLACCPGGEPRKSEPHDVINVSLTVTVFSLLLL